MRISFRFKNQLLMLRILLLWALSDGSLFRTTLLFDAHGGPESKSWITIFIASPSREVCFFGASKSSKAGPWYGFTGFTERVAA
jgi:hypothetical protein